MEFFVGNLIVAGLSDWGCVLIPTGLPAELIPHNFPEVETSGKEMLKQETFYEVQSWGCVSALPGLPAELIPQMFVPCLTTGVIIPALCRIVNSFFGIFCKKIPAGEMPFPAGKMTAKKLTLLRSAGRRSAVRHGSGSPQGPWSGWLRAACKWRCTRRCTASTDRPRSYWRSRESRSRSSS